MAMVTWCLLVATPMTGMVHGFVVPTGTTTAPRLSSIVTPKTQKTTTTTTTTRTTTTTTSTSTTALYGIPKMFRWLTDQYPDIVNRQLEQGLSEDLQVENFYLDMVRYPRNQPTDVPYHVMPMYHTNEEQNTERKRNEDPSPSCETLTPPFADMSFVLLLPSSFSFSRFLFLSLCS